MVPRVLILGTGLIGASLGLGLKALGKEFGGTVLGWDANPAELAKALEIGALDHALQSAEAALETGLADVYVLATPVLPILDWMQRLAPKLRDGQLVTDVGSTKLAIVRLASELYNGAGQAAFLPSHPMAGKESGGAALAEATLFREAAWIFTPGTPAGNGVPGAENGAVTSQAGEVTAQPRALERRWREWIAALGAQSLELEAAEHDRMCAWVSHLPQMLSTALAALLEETFAGDPQGREMVRAIGGRALRETTRLGSSPYSMWRDVALTNTPPVAATLHALEQKLAFLRENLRTPGLREAFEDANRFRSR